MEREEALKIAAAFALGASIVALLVLSLFVFFPSFFTYPCSVEPVFSPNAEPEVLAFISSASDTLDVEMYVFTYDKVAEALANASRRGVRVRVILEKRLDDNSANQRNFDYLRANGVEVRWASYSYKLTHSKFLVADGKRVLVGSINFSNSALNSNREAAVVFQCPSVEEFVAAFEADWGQGSAS
jgi:phosphatidylserine/phosphatidylglycerophosphate/cardiolipin synthase-like enzyme